jgi:hypothetical protein
MHWWVSSLFHVKLSTPVRSLMPSIIKQTVASSLVYFVQRIRPSFIVPALQIFSDKMKLNHNCFHLMLSEDISLAVTVRLTSGNIKIWLHFTKLCQNPLF